MTEKELLSIVASGENDRIEFKRSYNVDVIETLVAFANTRGGMVFIGVSDSKSITGLQANAESLQGWVNEIKTKTSPSIIPEAEMIETGGKKVAVLSLQEYPIKPISTRKLL